MIREYTIDFSDTEKAVRTTIEMLIDGLVDIRERGAARDPAELEWDIRLYQYILAEDTVARYEAYKAARQSVPGVLRQKREVVRLLGWEIP